MSMRRPIIVSLGVGVALSVATAVVAGLELLPLGESTTSARFDMEGAHPFGASWLLTIDETPWVRFPRPFWKHPSFRGTISA